MIPLYTVLGGGCDLEFLGCDNEHVIFYTRGRAVFVAVSLDPFAPQEAMIDLPLTTLQIAEYEDFAVENLLTGSTMRWVGARQRIRLEPEAPALVVRIRSSR